MELEQVLNTYKKQTFIIPREEKILETIEKSQDIFATCEQEQRLPYFEFLMGQFRMIRKRWWVLQTILLCTTAILLPYMPNKGHMLRSLGVVGVLYVVLIIPEFWKNHSNHCMQIEGTCFYSLRQIYAARMMLFGMVDMLILTCFCMTAKRTLGIALTELFIQFLFPMLVAACICFGTLCSKYLVNESTAILLCLMWSAVWYLIVMNEAVYQAIAFPMWNVLFGGCVVFFVWTAYKTIYDCNQYWEVHVCGITTGSSN